MVTRVIKRKKVSRYKFRTILKLFCLDLTAKQIAEITGLNRNTINRYLRFIREQLAQICERESPFSGEIEVDESFFGAKHIKGKRGRGAYGKTIVFGIFKRNGKVYTEIVPDCARSTLQAVIRGRVSIDSIIHSDKWRGYNGLVDLGYKKHFRVDHGKNEFARKSAHINGIEGFWGFAKSRLSKFKGIHRSTIYLHLKECEYRFNYRNEDLYQKLLTIFKV